LHSVNVSRGGCYRQFGRASAPMIPHRVRSVASSSSEIVKPRASMIVAVAPFGALRSKHSARRRPASPGSARRLFDNAIKLGKFVGLEPAQKFFVNCQYRVVLSRWRRLHAVRVFVPDGPGERFSDRPFSEFMKALRQACATDKKIRLTEITVSTANATAKGLKNRIFSPGQGRRGSCKP
jgi:hypothetical protein